MRTEELLRGIAPEWRESFVRFVQTGEAEDEFLNYLNRDKDAQQAVEAAFDAQAQAFQEIAEEMKKDPAPDAATSVAGSTIDVSIKAAQAVEDVMGLLSQQERREAMRKTAVALKASLGPDQKELLLETLMDTLGVAIHNGGAAAHK